MTAVRGQDTPSGRTTRSGAMFRIAPVYASRRESDHGAASDSAEGARQRNRIGSRAAPFPCSSTDLPRSVAGDNEPASLRRAPKRWPPNSLPSRGIEPPQRARLASPQAPARVSSLHRRAPRVQRPADRLTPAPGARAGLVVGQLALPQVLAKRLRQPDQVHRQQQQMQQQHRHDADMSPVGDERHVARDGDSAKRQHRAHPECRQHERRREIAERFVARHRRVARSGPPGYIAPAGRGIATQYAATRTVARPMRGSGSTCEKRTRNSPANTKRCGNGGHSKAHPYCGVPIPIFCPWPIRGSVIRSADQVRLRELLAANRGATRCLRAEGRAEDAVALPARRLRPTHTRRPVSPGKAQSNRAAGAASPAVGNPVCPASSTAAAGRSAR